MQTRARTIAQKAIAYGFDGVQVDGNDVLAVYVATRDAVQKARAGGGPTLIECVTYRLGVHTTADDPTKYRSDEEVKVWERRDPLTALMRLARFAEVVVVDEVVNLFRAGDEHAGHGLERLHEAARVERHADLLRAQELEQLALCRDVPATVARTVGQDPSRRLRQSAFHQSVPETPADQLGRMVLYKAMCDLL